MNDTSLCIFDVSHLIRTFRDTLQFTMPEEIDVQSFEQRKLILNAPLDEKTFVGKFIKDREKQFEKFITSYKEYIDKIYGDDSTILTKTAEGKIRVDHSQHIAIYQGFIEAEEVLRDIMFFYFQHGVNNKLLEDVVGRLVDADERFDRTIKLLFLINQFKISFGEFQKVMAESKGQPTPQSNFITQNELSVLANYIRFTRDHCHMKDNQTLDIYDDVVELIQMCEGRRDRRDNKPFPDLFNTVIHQLNELINKAGPVYDKAYREALADAQKTIAAKNANNGGTEGGTTDGGATA